MAKINVDSDQWAWIVFAYLFDKYLNFDDVSAGNEEFNDVMRKLKPRLFPICRGMYLDSPADMKMKYKLIKDGFRNDSSINSIFIVPKGKGKEEEPGIIKKLIKKVVKAITSSNEFSTEEIEYLKEQLGDE